MKVKSSMFSGQITYFLIITVLIFSAYILNLLIKSWRSFNKENSELNRLVMQSKIIQVDSHDDSKFFRYSKFIKIKKDTAEIQQQTRSINNLFLRRKRNSLLKEISLFDSNLEKTRILVNEQFYKKEKHRAKEIFQDINGNDLLTEEQIRAVLCDDDRNLVIAGAGSGKTRVIDFKIRYLVKYKNVNPQRILLLSFSKKSAKDLQEKISQKVSGVEARTIHSFAYGVLKLKKDNVLNNEQNELGFFVIKALIKTLKENESYLYFQEFYKKFFSGLKPFIFYLKLETLREDLKKINSEIIKEDDPFEGIKLRRSVKTLKGDYVRSLDERYIADFLYLNNIQYEYEKKYPNCHERYFPDFYLSDYDIYWEHFAITSKGKAPSFFKNPDQYLEGMIWKRKLHQLNGTKLIESYSYLLNGDFSSEYLSKLLEKEGIQIQHTPGDESAYKKISLQFNNLFTKFYNTFKLSGLSLADLKKTYPEKKYLLFLNVFEKFFVNIERILNFENKVDFNDIIITSEQKYEQLSSKTYDYIIIDEFQDTSRLAMRLLNKVYSSFPNSSLSVVGDDWQSIYGFNGSDVTILSKYNDCYPGVSTLYLNNNFRSHEKIVNLGRDFVLRNPAQIPKNVASKNGEFNTSEVDFLSFQQMENKISSIPDDESIFVLYRYNDDAPYVHGIFKDFFTLDKNRKSTRNKNCKKKISLMTIHASKGLEARHVFVLFPKGSRKKFPSDFEDHYIFNMLKLGSDNFPYSEERRLMYVAITRAEQNLYFVKGPTSESVNSCFWDEIQAQMRS
jgi:DNA helicase-4